MRMGRRLLHTGCRPICATAQPDCPQCVQLRERERLSVLPQQPLAQELGFDIDKLYTGGLIKNTIWDTVWNSSPKYIGNRVLKAFDMMDIQCLSLIHI